MLEVTPTLSLRELKKLSRRYAMTGGYELALKKDLSLEELKQMKSLYLPALEEYKDNVSAKRACNAFRILELITEDANCSPELRSELLEILQ